MKWDVIRLRDICDRITKGTTPSSIGYGFIEKGINYIKSESITQDGRIDSSKFAYIDSATNSALERSQLQYDDILISIAGMFLGKTAIVQSRHLPANTNQAVGIIRLKQNTVNPKYIYLYLQQNNVVLLINQSNSQSAQPNINLQQIGDLQICLPPLSVQNMIVSILSAYDDLIENNLQRIKLLEQAAKCEYKLLMSKCKDYKDVSLSDVATVNQNSLRSNFAGEILYIDIASVNTGSIDSIQLFDIKNAPSRAKRIVSNEDIIWSCVRPNRKSFAFIINPKENTIASTGFAVLSAVSIPSTFLFLSVTTDEFVSYLESHATGAAYPAVSGKDFEKAAIKIPTDKAALDAFHNSVLKYYKLINTLSEQNTKLRRARNILLPKLMSGQIDVSNLHLISKLIPLQAPVVSMVAEDAPAYQTKKPKGGAKYYFRTLLAAYIVKNLWQERTFGHVKLMKLMYLSEHVAHIETVSNYHRDAAGPYDNQMMWSIDKQLKKEKWFEMYRKDGKYPKYKPMEKATDFMPEFAKYHSDKQTGIDSLIQQFGTASTEKVEMVATVYEAWRYLSTNNHTVSIDAILNEILNLWHESKARISRERWVTCYEWVVGKGWIN